MTARSPPPAADERVLALATLFGMLYFIQGISEPTEGLLSQPTRSLLTDWGYEPRVIGTFVALLALPWSIKPLYGFLTDFVPLGPTRRRSWLLVTTAATSLTLILLYQFPPVSGMVWMLLAWLLIPTIGVAFSDVVVDALMVETGQSRGLTGRLQSVQWACMYAATILTGWLGGWLSQHQRQDLGFLIAGVATGISFILVFVVVREPPIQRPPTRPADAFRTLWQSLRHPGILAIGAFLFLWSFNPFSTVVLQYHMTETLGFSEQFYGNTVSVQACAAVLASAAYGLYCRRLSAGLLVHLSIVTGIVATIAYWWLDDERSAWIISAVVGFVYMTATIIQLDLAARVCSPETAGTTFALLMSLSNLAVALSAWVGGYLYESLGDWRNAKVAFDFVVAIGALFTCGCWLLVPTLRRFCVPQANGSVFVEDSGAGNQEPGVPAAL